jgi:Protein of unknown function (DUF3237)
VSPEPDALELVPLGRMTIHLRQPFVLAGVPAGTRVIVEVEDARFDGERLSGRAKGSANADWATIGHDGTAALDVRALLETDDGALIFVQYTGRLHLPTQTTYATPLFETGDDRYTWLNQVQAVGKGTTDGSTLVYDVLEMR